MSIHLVSVSSSIVEDDFENGEGRDTGCGLDEHVGKTFDDWASFYQYLAANFGLSSDVAAYEVCDGYVKTEKTVADHSTEQNGGWFEATAEEISAWKKGKCAVRHNLTRI